MYKNNIKSQDIDFFYFYLENIVLQKSDSKEVLISRIRF